MTAKHKVGDILDSTSGNTEGCSAEITEIGYRQFQIMITVTTDEAVWSIGETLTLTQMDKDDGGWTCREDIKDISIEWEDD